MSAAVSIVAGPSCASLAAELDAIAATHVPYVEKAQRSFALVAEAARLLEGDPDLVPALREQFAIEGGAILVSAFGLTKAGSRGSFSGTRPLAVRSVGGVVRVDVAQAWESDDVVAHTRALVARHGWVLTPKRRARLDARATLRGFLGLGRHELVSLFHSPQGRAVAPTMADLADVVYPLWKPRALGLTLTYRCNATCGHCYNVSGPERRDACLGWSETGSHLDAWILAGVTDIGISGGEPFLYPDTIVSMVGELKRRNVPLVSPFTNGFWGADAENAERILRRLRGVGFGTSPKDQIKISTGEFHLEHVPFSSVLTVARLHKAIVGTRVMLDVAFVKDETVLARLVEEAKAAGVADDIEWTARTAVSDSGRAKEWHGDLEQAERRLDTMKCPIKASASLYQGRGDAGEWVYCSGTSYPTSYRRVGALDSDGPFAIMARAQRDPRVPYWQLGSFGDYLRDHPRAGLDADGALVTAARSTVCGACRTIFAPKSAGTTAGPQRRLPLV